MNYNLLDFNAVNTEMYFNTYKMWLLKNVETPTQSPVYLLQKLKVHTQLLL